MLDIGSFRTRDCHGMTRRSFVSAATSLPLAWGLPQLSSALASDGNSQAKSVVFVWLWGGPSQLETFDPKPHADSNVRGAFAPIRTQTPGVYFSEVLPQLARCSDKFSVVRSSLLNGNHDTGVLRGIGKVPGGGKKTTGEKSGPCFGSVVAKKAAGSALPPYIALTPRTTLSHGVNADNDRAIGAGKLGANYNPFFVKCSTRGELDVASLRLLPDLTPDRLADRRSLRATFEELRRKIDGVPLGSYNEHLEGAYELLTTPGTVQAFNLGEEKAETRNRYGRTYFGQAMLLARRLAEERVPYIHVNWSQGVDSLEEGPRMGWDLHRNLFGQMASYHGPIFDRAMSALLEDLDDRGLLDDTLVVAHGEMGRTPRVQGSGRGHWATASTLWAGGGVRRGEVIGATDKNAGEPVTRPLTARDIGATVCHSLGINVAELTQMGVLTGSEVYHDLFA